MLKSLDLEKMGIEMTLPSAAHHLLTHPPLDCRGEHKGEARKREGRRKRWEAKRDYQKSTRGI